MRDITSSDEAFDIELASECVTAFSKATGLGCTLSRVSGEILHEAGFGLSQCRLCACRAKTECVQAHAYGMDSAERFGGKYIYFCPMGLTFFVSPIEGAFKSAARIAVGPFLMVDRDDYIAFELNEVLRLSQAEIKEVMEGITGIAYVPPEKVNPLATLLFMAVGFMSNVSATNRMLTAQSSDAIQGQITSYIQELKKEPELPPYPLQTEQALLHSIERGDRTEAAARLNQLLGHIFFSSGREFARIRTRIYELLILISRAAIAGGANTEQTLLQNDNYFAQLQNINNIDDLCFWLSGAMNRFMDSVFLYRDVKHTDMIRKALHYIRLHYTEKITLDQVAKGVYLSPTYFSKVFKQEVGKSFSEYINHLRIEKSKALLRDKRFSLMQVAVTLGYEDQSYFSKVFKKFIGVSPSQFRKTPGKSIQQKQSI